MSEIDTSNDFFVGSRGADIVLMKTPGTMTKAQALRLAAWLVILADDDEVRFNEVLEAIKDI